MAGNGNFTSPQSTDSEGNVQMSGQLSKHFCQPCSHKSKETAAVVYCSTCNEFQCTNCSNGHNIYSFMKNHTTVDADEACETSDVYDMNGLDRCEKHDKHVKFFCYDDNKLCCSTCAIIKHRKCNVVDEIKNIKMEKRCIDSLNVKINKMKERSKAAVNYLRDGEQYMQEQVEHLRENLGSLRISMNRKYDYLEQDIKQQLTSVSEMKASQYSQSRDQCRDIITELENGFKTLETARRLGTPDQLFIAQHRVNESFESMNEKASVEFSKLEKVELSLELSEGLKMLTCSNKGLGWVTKTTEAITIDEIVEGRPVKLKQIVSVDLQKGIDDTEVPIYSGIDFLSDGRLVVADKNNQKCFIFSDRLEQVGSYELSAVPQSLATISKDKVAVVFRGVRKIDILHISSANEITLFNTVHIKALQYNSICLKHNGELIVGTVGDIKPVRIVTNSGEGKDLRIDFPSETYDCNSSACTYITNSDKLVFTDRYRHIVYIYDISSNTNVIIKDNQINEPTDVAIGRFDNIFVCCNGTHSIVQISQTGRILCSHKLDILFPYRVGISMDKRKLSVSNNVNGKRALQLYNIQF